MNPLGDLLSSLFERRYSGVAAKDSRSIEEMCRDLLTSTGEVSGHRLARLVFDRYAALDDKGRLRFFRYLTEELDVDPDAVAEAAAAYGEDRSAKALRKLLTASEPRRQELARRLNQVPGATGRLVEMRRDLLRFAREDETLLRSDLDFRHLFMSWFNRGFLVLRPISWDSPASILQHIIAYEAVHAIQSWEDLRRRLEPGDRRCFAFFHPAMPDDPLIFVEVALTRGIPDSIQGVLAEERAQVPPEEADTAVFYSISNCQKGLAGISFGNSLIKQVVADLSRELPHLKTFVTLSPMPRLNKWLSTRADEDPRAAAVLEAAESGKGLDAQAEAVRQFAAHYLLEAKDDRGNPLDPVARFHLTNGAQVHDVHAGADTSPNGLAQSSGAMVNYLYDPRRIEQNHESFAADGRIAATRAVTSLARIKPADTRQKSGAPA